jgi:Domain of unknown function (DUF6382)
MPEMWRKQMNLRELNYELELPEEYIKPFERKVLESGLCDFAVPMSFYRHNGKQKIRYECSGYVAFSEANLTDTSTIFEIIEKTLLALKKSGEYLIDPCKVPLTKDTVYVHYRNKDVRIAYVPGNKNGYRGQQNLLDFFLEVEERIPATGKSYVQKLRQEVTVNNRSLPDLITIVGEIRREMFLCEVH